MIRFLFSYFLISCSLTLTGQQVILFPERSNEDTLKNKEKDQLDYLYGIYSSRIDPSYELINGRAYFTYYFNSDLKPVLFLDKNHRSSVTINGRRFDNVNLDYDTFTDEIIYIDYSRICVFIPLRVALNRDYVDKAEFITGGDSISMRYFSKKADSMFNIKDGWYEVVSERKSRYLIKHSSILKKDPGMDEYIYIKKGYVNTGSGFSEITSKKKFLTLFGDRAGEVRKFIGSRRIRIRRADKAQVMSILNYYDNLTTRNN